MTDRSRVLLILIGSVLAARLGLSALLPFMDTTEPRYAEIARIMAETGDWITPWFDYGVPFWGKPPLSFWAEALSFRLFGVSEFAGRLPSWLATVGTVVLVYVLTQKLDTDLSDKRKHIRGLWAALIFSTMALTFLSAGTVMTDAYLTLGTTLALVGFILRLQGYSILWGWALFAGLAIGLLAKGPISLVLTGLPILAWLLAVRRWRETWRRLPWLTGTLTLTAVVLPWYVVAEMKTPGFLDYFLIGEHFKRFVISDWQGDLYGNAHDFTRGTIWLYLVLGSFPWGFLLLAGVVKRFRQSIGRENSPSAGIGDGLFVIAATLAPAFFFTLSGNILWTYILPGLPFLAVLVVTYCPVHEPGPTARRAFLAACLVPFVGVGASIWLNLNSSGLKTEKYLIQRYEEQTHHPMESLRYLNEAPFSARYYSKGRVQTITWNQLTAQLDEPPPRADTFLAVRKGNQDAIRALRRHFPVIDSNRRYLLFSMKKSSSLSDAALLRDLRSAG